MRISTLRTHKASILSWLLVMVAAVLGADCSFAMAVAEPELSGDANPSNNMGVYDPSTNPGGRPADEALQVDEQGGRTQLQGHAATATDVRDAGLEAEDYDADVDNFRKHRFPTETLIARKCRPVKVNSYVHGHYRSGSTDLEATFLGVGSPSPADLSITIGTNTAGTYVAKNNIVTIPSSSFDNPDCLMEYSTVSIKGVEGFKADNEGNLISDGSLVLFVLNHKTGDEKVKFKILNPPANGATLKIPVGTSFYVMATAGSESQMRVASETYLPEKHDVTLQKKIVTCIITDEFQGQDKKVSIKTQNVLANAEYNFKRKCARSHWDGTGLRFDIDVPETGAREAIYTENGILRQIPMLYTHGENLTDNDLLALTTLMFTNNSVSDEADVACGKKAMARFIKLVNSADKYKDVSKVNVNEYGIKVRNYADNFGTLHFYWDPTLDDLGYEEYMAVIDFSHADRPYKRNDSKTSQDMKETGEAREAVAHNLCRIDCVALNGYNAILVCPSTVALNSANLGGIVADFAPAATSAAVTDKTKKYYLSADMTLTGTAFSAGTVVEYDSDLDKWIVFEGLVRA